MATVGQTRTRDGAVLAYVVVKAAARSPSAPFKPPVIVVPDVFQVKEDLADLAAALAQDGRDVCVVDLRGMGGSIQCPPMPPATEPPEITLMQLATDVFDVLLALSWTQPALLGLGAGGMVAQYLALLLRGRDDVALAGLVLAGSAPMTPSRGSRLARAALELAQDRPAGSSVGSAGMGAGVAATQDADPVRAWIAANLTEPFCKQNPQRVAAIAGSWGSTSRSKLIGAEQVFAMDGVNLTDQLGLLAVPTLVIHGESDAMIDSSYGVMLSETIRNAHLAFIPKAGHWLHVMATDVLVKETTRFLASPSANL